jgi:uncharacterized protein (TIGR04255 family)
MEAAGYRESIGNLKNKPLVEAIFELGWSVPDPTNQFLDVLPGLYYNEIREHYPFIENLPASQVPLPLVLNAVRHRFRKEKDAWPLTQLGPGVLTVNDTDGYTTWKDFLPRITNAVSALAKVYNKAEPFTRAELRYINAVEFDPQRQPFARFVQQNLHTSIALPRLSDGEGATSDVANANITAQVNLKRPKGRGEIIVALGTYHEKPAVIFHINVRSHGENAPKSQQDIQKWANDAHVIIDTWFMSFCEGHLLESFKG